MFNLTALSTMSLIVISLVIKNRQKRPGLAHIKKSESFVGNPHDKAAFNKIIFKRAD